MVDVQYGINVGPKTQSKHAGVYVVPHVCGSVEWVSWRDIKKRRERCLTSDENCLWIGMSPSGDGDRDRFRHTDAGVGGERYELSGTDSSGGGGAFRTCIGERERARREMESLEVAEVSDEYPSTSFTSLPFRVLRDVEDEAGEDSSEDDILKGFKMSEDC